MLMGKNSSTSNTVRYIHCHGSICIFLRRRATRVWKAALEFVGSCDLKRARMQCFSPLQGTLQVSLQVCLQASLQGTKTRQVVHCINTKSRVIVMCLCLHVIFRATSTPCECRPIPLHLCVEFRRHQVCVGVWHREQARIAGNTALQHILF